MITSFQKYYVTHAFLANPLYWLAEIDVNAWYANVNQKKKNFPFGLVLSKQIHIKPF